jgi:hypothetical protein
MTGARRVISAFAIVSIAMLGGTGAAFVTSASASPALASFKCGYPPHRCTLDANQGTYKPGQTVKIHTPKHAFATNESVGVNVTGPHGYQRHYNGRSGAQGGFSTSFKLGKHAKAGTYHVSLTGKRDGHHLTGNITVS